MKTAEAMLAYTQIDANRQTALVAAGVSGVLAKPVTAARLFSAIQSVMATPPGGARSWAPA